MRTIKIIDTVFLKDGVLRCKTIGGKGSQEFFIRQGDLDGACTAYSLVMTLMIIRAVNRKTFNLYQKVNGTTNDGRLVKQIMCEKGLYKEGMDYKEVKLILNRHYKKKVVTVLQEEVKNDQVVDIINNNIENNQPTIISLFFNGGAHSIVAIGLELDNKDKVAKILCIDPGFEPSKTSVWNSLIVVGSANRGKYPYIWETNDNTPVNLGETLTVYKRENK